MRAQDAPEPPGYRETVREALAEYQAKNFPEARALFTEAHRLFPNARTLRGLGMTAFELRSYVEAIGYLQDALASQVKPLEGGLRADAERLLSRAQRFVGKLTLSLEPPNTEVLLNGQPVELKPGAPLVLEIGDHNLEFRAPGHLSETRTLHVKGRDAETWTVVLSPVPAPEPVAQVPTPEQVAVSEFQEPAPLDGAPEERPTKTPAYKNPWLWASVGLVVVAGVVTATMLATRDPELEPVSTNEGRTPPRGIFQALGSEP